MSDDLAVLHHSAKSDDARALAAATNRRLKARGLDSFTVPEKPVVSKELLVAVRKAAWALGALSSTYESVTDTGNISVGVQRMIRNPGKRTDRQKKLGEARMSAMRADRKKRAKAAAATKGKRAAIVKAAQHAAANYRRNPGGYHYLAGGVANLVYLEPSPSSWRSDCSQFVGSVYADVGLPSPANVEHKYASTYSIVKCPQARITDNPRPGDLGMYGSRSGPLASRSTHHVEVYCQEPGQEFIGHGSPPIDSITPGRPDFYVTFDFLD